MDYYSEFGDYVPFAERLSKQNLQTPDRFKRQPVFRESNAQKWVNRKVTKARAPRFATDQRSRDLRRQRMKNSGKSPKKSGKKVQG